MPFSFPLDSFPLLPCLGATLRGIFVFLELAVVELRGCVEANVVFVFPEMDDSHVDMEVVDEQSAGLKKYGIPDRRGPVAPMGILDRSGIKDCKGAECLQKSLGLPLEFLEDGEREVERGNGGTDTMLAGGRSNK